jgi:hypothetical protein
LRCRIVLLGFRLAVTAGRYANARRSAPLEPRVRQLKERGDAFGGVGALHHRDEPGDLRGPVEMSPLGYDLVDEAHPQRAVGVGVETSTRLPCHRLQRQTVDSAV